MFHWTDSKIRVHAFYCVLALTLVSLLRRALHQAGLDLSMTRMLESLGEIQEVLLVYPKQAGEAQPRTGRCLTTMSSETQQLFNVLKLASFQRA